MNRSGDQSGAPDPNDDTAMDWEDTKYPDKVMPGSANIEMAQLSGRDSKATNFSAGDSARSPTTKPPPYGAGGQGEDAPSAAAGGEGLQDDSSDTDSSFENIAETYDNVGNDQKQMNKPSRYDGNRTWKGVALNVLKKAPGCLPTDLKLERSNQHFIAIKMPFEYGENRMPESLYTLSQSRWDTDHVRMPFANESKCSRNGRERKRWEVIVEALKAPIRGTFELEEAILKYNQRYVNRWNFAVLHHYFLKFMSKEDSKTFFDAVLPLMVTLALRLPDLCPLVPLLRKGKPKKLTLGQNQIACLLANAFFCTFPLRNAKTRASEYSDYPDINFSHLFTGKPEQRKLEKLQCIVHYFRRVLQEEPKGIVTFSRQMISGHNWQGSMENLSWLHVSSTGTIEDNGEGMLQVDFANKYIGGGVLGHGCVQEEIRFVICPEMIVTRLFTECLDSKECLIMTGCERYSEYEGYSDSFRWKGNFEDLTERDTLGRLSCEVVAIDAQVFRSDYYKQFKASNVDRELNKAYCGFKTSFNEVNTPAVCTGNWGCGAFGGDKQLKALIQIMAASVAKRDVCYFTFDDEQLTTDLYNVHNRLCKENKTVGELYSMLEEYNWALTGGHRSNVPKLFDFIHNQLDKKKKPNRRPESGNFWGEKDQKKAPIYSGESITFWGSATKNSRKSDSTPTQPDCEKGACGSPKSGDSFWKMGTENRDEKEGSSVDYRH